MSEIAQHEFITHDKPAPHRSNATETTHKWDTFVDFVAGAVGGTACVLAGQPLDTVKVKQQAFPSYYKGAYHCFKDTFVSGGIKGLYAGTVPALMANIAENSVLFLSYGLSQKTVAFMCCKDLPEHLNSCQNAVAGSGAALVACFALCPTELVKCRLQGMTESARAAGMPKPNVLFRSYYNLRRYLWLLPLSRCDMFRRILHLSVSFQLRKFESQERLIEESFFNPESLSWSPKKRIYLLVSQVCKDIFRNDGVLGYYRGFGALCAREMPGYFCFFGGYELSRSLLSKPGETKETIGLFRLMLCGGIAGACFWTSIFPIDVVKSRLQINAGRTNVSFIRMLFDIYRNEGIRMLYSGLPAAFIRSFPANAALFVSYEYTRKLLNPNLFNRKNNNVADNNNTILRSCLSFLDLEKIDVYEIDLVQLPFFNEIQWLVDFSVASWFVYLLTELYFHLVPAGMDETLNLSVIWSLLVIWLAFYQLATVTGIYFVSSLHFERTMCLCFSFVSLVTCMALLLLPEKYLALGISTGYSQFSESTTSFLKKQRLLDTIQPLSEVTFKVALAVSAAVMGGLLTFPGFRYSKTHLDSHNYKGKMSQLRIMLLDISLILPVFLAMSWFAPLGVDLFKDMVHAPESFTEYFESFRLWAILSFCALRLFLFRTHMQSHLELAELKIEIMSCESGKVSFGELKELTAGVFYSLAMVAVQYLAPVIACLHLVLVLKTTGGVPWFGGAPYARHPHAVLPPPFLKAVAGFYTWWLLVCSSMTTLCGIMHHKFSESHA